MAEKKKDPNAGKKRGSRSAAAYVADNRRYFNKVKAVKRHLRGNPNDFAAKEWLGFMNSELAIHYTRGAERVIAAQKRIYGFGQANV